MAFMIEKKLVEKEVCDRLFDEWLNERYNGNAEMRERYEKLWERI